MNDTEDNNELIRNLVFGVLELQGMQSANNTILHSLLSIVCENAPALIEPFKQKITDVSELKVVMNEFSSDIAKTAFQKEINQALLQFNLIEEASTYSPTFIEVKSK